jgi:hypothetical protein
VSIVKHLICPLFNFICPLFNFFDLAFCQKHFEAIEDGHMVTAELAETGSPVNGRALGSWSLRPK